MKKITIFLIILLAIALAINFVPTDIKPVYAQARYGGKRASATADTELLLAAGTWVYGISIYASSTNAELGIYDSATLEGAGNNQVKDEIGEATQFDHADRVYAKPIYFTNGVTVIVNNGTGFVDYGPEP